MRHLAKEAHYLASGGVRGSGSGVDRQSMGGSVRRYGATLGLVVFCVTGGTLTPTAGAVRIVRRIELGELPHQPVELAPRVIELPVDQHEAFGDEPHMRGGGLGRVVGDDATPSSTPPRA